jgi:hypothetical protein
VRRRFSSIAIVIVGLMGQASQSDANNWQGKMFTPSEGRVRAARSRAPRPVSTGAVDPSCAIHPITSGFDSFVRRHPSKVWATTSRPKAGDPLLIVKASRAVVRVDGTTGELKHNHFALRVGSKVAQQLRKHGERTDGRYTADFQRSSSVSTVGGIRVHLSRETGMEDKLHVERPDGTSRPLVQVDNELGRRILANVRFTPLPDRVVLAVGKSGSKNYVVDSLQFPDVADPSILGPCRLFIGESDGKMKRIPIIRDVRGQDEWLMRTMEIETVAGTLSLPWRSGGSWATFTGPNGTRRDIRIMSSVKPQGSITNDVSAARKLGIDSGKADPPAPVF